MTVPDALPALLAVGKSLKAAARNADLPEHTLHLAYLRASQINGCAFCIDMHTRDALRSGESPDRLFAVAAWRESPLFTDAERAALELTESITRLADRPESVSDELWSEATAQYDEPALATLLLGIAMINFWNRLNTPIKQPPGPLPA
jgi:AhpD family alkylhydroperoxidase